jgi:hypothetical protein
MYRSCNHVAQDVVHVMYAQSNLLLYLLTAGHDQTLVILSHA